MPSIAASLAMNCYDISDGAGSGYQPMMQPSSAQPPAVYGLTNNMQASDSALLLLLLLLIFCNGYRYSITAVTNIDKLL